MLGISSAPMMHNQSAPGVCPRCNHELAAGSVLITYEKSDGTTGLFAECPVCADVVRPVKRE